MSFSCTRSYCFAYASRRQRTSEHAIGSGTRLAFVRTTTQSGVAPQLGRRALKSMRPGSSKHACMAQHGVLLLCDSKSM